ncbi:hypothetical protein [Bifidobacterium sp.]|uniref:hypothetical protein n=1 Tax=Bifidobacterium sp. TaxID=41200 RepID=UPI0039E887B1
MTLVRIRLRDAAGNPVNGNLLWTPTIRYKHSGTLRLPVAMKVTLTQGNADVNLTPSTQLWAWRVTEMVPEGTIRHVIVPNTLQHINYGDLTDIDPTTLKPSPSTIDLIQNALKNKQDTLTTGPGLTLEANTLKLNLDNIDIATNTQLDSEREAREQADQELSLNITQEAAARQLADNNLDSKITNLTSKTSYIEAHGLKDTDIIDNTITGGSSKPLSAEAGKTLATAIHKLEQRSAYAGAADTPNDLPTSQEDATQLWGHEVNANDFATVRTDTDHDNAPTRYTATTTGTTIQWTYELTLDAPERNFETTPITTNELATAAITTTKLDPTITNQLTKADTAIQPTKLNSEIEKLQTTDTTLANSINAKADATALAAKQDKLAAGDNVSILGSTISVTGLATSSALADEVSEREREDGTLKERIKAIEEDYVTSLDLPQIVVCEGQTEAEAESIANPLSWCFYEEGE